jgi:hypothetical protein
MPALKNIFCCCIKKRAGSATSALFVKTVFRVCFLIGREGNTFAVARAIAWQFSANYQPTNNLLKTSFRSERRKHAFSDYRPSPGRERMLMQSGAFSMNLGRYGFYRLRLNGKPGGISGRYSPFNPYAIAFKIADGLFGLHTTFVRRRAADALSVIDRHSEQGADFEGSHSGRRLGNAPG